MLFLSISPRMYLKLWWKHSVCANCALMYEKHKTGVLEEPHKNTQCPAFVRQEWNKTLNLIQFSCRFYIWAAATHYCLHSALWDIPMLDPCCLMLIENLGNCITYCGHSLFENVADNYKRWCYCIMKWKWIKYFGTKLDFALVTWDRLGFKDMLLLKTATVCLG